MLQQARPLSSPACWRCGSSLQILRVGRASYACGKESLSLSTAAHVALVDPGGLSGPLSPSHVAFPDEPPAIRARLAQRLLQMACNASQRMNMLATWANAPFPAAARKFLVDSHLGLVLRDCDRLSSPFAKQAGKQPIESLCIRCVALVG